MFTSIINAIVAIMTSLTTSAGALNKVAISLDNLATVAEQASAGYVDEAKADREIAQLTRAAERAKKLKELQAQP